MFDWSYYFDAIYCIHFLPFKDRVERITSELKRIGIIDSTVFRWKYTFDSPFYANLLHSDIRLFHDSLHRIPMLKCTLSHYDVYKEAEGLGYGRILIIEDDVVFLKDIDYIHRTIDMMPTEYDVIQFDYWTFTRPEYDYYVANTRINERYAAFANRMSSGAMYSVDSKAIKFMIERQEKSLHAGDTAWHAEEPNDGIRRCFSVKCLSHQQPYHDGKTNAEMLNFYNNCRIDFGEYNV